jgi:hypothetical protein
MGIFKKVERRSCGCCLFVVLGFLLLVAGLVFLVVKAASAESAPPPAYDVALVSDQSASMWDCDGIGTDPELLRVDATRLFINTLGADSSARYRLALLHFGGEVVQAAPLTDLADATARQALIEAASYPQPMRWTDHLLALRAARQLLQVAGQPGSQRLIVLLTDGEPAPNPVMHSSGYDEARYVQDLHAAAVELARADTALAVVLLSDTRTSCGRRAATSWADRWRQAAEMTPGGALYVASQADDLLPIYHAIVRQMLGVAKGAAPPMTALLTPDTPLVVDAPVAEPLASLILTIWKHDPATTVEVRDPAGQAVARGGAALDQADVTVTGFGTAGREEVWRIAQPRQGIWRVILAGQGRINVWQDRLPLPTPTPSVTPTASPTLTVSPTPAPTATRTPTASPSAQPSRGLAAPIDPGVTRQPSATATVTRSVTPETTVMVADASTPDGEPGGGRSAWPLWAGGGVTLGLAALGLIAVRRPGPCLTGQLTPLATPAGSTLVLPRDLSVERRRQVILGRRGEQAWRLDGWDGAVRLTAESSRSVTISPMAGAATLNGQPLRQVTPLEDGAVIGCGEYQIRYENLLA